MHADMLADLSHLYFLEATEARTEREMRYLLKCSRELAVKAVKEGRREERRTADSG